MMKPVSYAPAVVFGFRGRIGRRQFAVSALYQGILTLAMAFALIAMAGSELAESLAEASAGDPASFDFRAHAGAIAFAVVAQSAISVLTLTSARARLNDLGLSVWWTAPMSIPSLAAAAAPFLPSGIGDIASAGGLFATVVMVAPLFAVPGAGGANAYGPPPGRAGGATFASARQSG